MVKIFLLLVWIIIGIINLLLVEGSAFLSVLTLIIWFLSCFYFFNKKDIVFSLSVLFFVFSYSFAAIMSLFAELNGSYFSEIRQYANLNNSTSRLLVLSFFVIFFAFIIYRFFMRYKIIDAGTSSSVNHILKPIIIILTMGLIMMMLSIYIRYGSSHNYGSDRFFYYKNIAPTYTLFVKFQLMNMMFFIGALYNESKKKIYIFIFMLSLISVLLIGERATAILQFTIFFTLPILLGSNIKFTTFLTPKIITVSLILVAFSVILMIYSYSKISGSDVAYDHLLNRLVLQGQMWWALDNIDDHNVKSVQYMMEHLFAFGGIDDKQFGLYYLMEQVTPDQIFEAYYNNGVAFTMGFPGNLIYFFSYPIAVIPAIFCGIILGFCSYVLIKSIKLKDYFLMFVALKMYIAAQQALTMGNIHVLFTFKFLLMVFIVSVYALLTLIAKKEKL